MPPGPPHGACAACGNRVSGPGSGTALPYWNDLVTLGNMAAKVKGDRIFDSTDDEPAVVLTRRCTTYSSPRHARPLGCTQTTSGSSSRLLRAAHPRPRDCV
eukprot:3464335-Heterocapsa_arctica.AAC.1